MKIAVDFDGTIVEHKFPQIGKEKPFAVLTLKKLMEDGHILVLNTAREGQYLEDAIKWCEERGLRFFAVNKNYPEETPDKPDYSRKLRVDLFIDDHNLGGLPDWGVIYDMIKNNRTYADITSEDYSALQPRKKSWWRRF